MKKRSCAYDQCCEFEPQSWNHRYCFEHNCKRKAEADKKREATFANQEAQFEQPLDFAEEHIRSAPDGYKVLVINDTQFPFHDQKTMACVENFWDEFEPDLEVYNGDMIDFYTISEYSKNPSRLGDLQSDIDGTVRWFDRRANENPDADRRWNKGNHEDRLRRFLMKYAKELQCLRSLEFDKLFEVERLGIKTLEYGSVLDFLGYRIEHGYKTSASRAYPVNISRFMASATGSSGLCGHSHHFSIYAWTDARGSHSYIENGCLCRFDMEYMAFPNWQQAFTYGIVNNNKVHLVPVQIYPDGFNAMGEFYERRPGPRR